ncbi:hypothetical protein NMY3_00836 [Candidatus Nitrosocosmicus oleophilus]|uniref:Uncharacterized protein n=1 Tax=Candidatus Nitrosocosmicus oleophilus TaxID=1353260 RepID=A0A654LV22_9ARCH|nr:hypothetical protein NMY3_00836 [Candidatus Nitrosocosmicus oleophilus]
MNIIDEETTLHSDNSNPERKDLILYNLMVFEYMEIDF